MKEYLVVRFCNKPDGTVATAARAYEDEVSALKEFYRGCGLAVDSDNLTDFVTLLHYTGYEIKHEYFVHEPGSESEPEPEEEENS